jgi:two-component system chemotaxis response regulator CheB
MDTLSMVHVLVVEDSITTRRFLVDLINGTPALMVVGEASDGLEAVQMVEELHPDVVSMDIQMPRMDGLQATQQIMAKTPTPIVVVSASLGQREVDVAMLSIEAGALAAVEKPTAAPDAEAKRREYIRMLRLMAGVRVIRRRPYEILLTLPANPPEIRSDTKNRPEIVVIGASAGGPAALAQVLSRLPRNFPLPVLVVQHLSADFVPGLTDWLKRRCDLPVLMALAGETPQPSQVWIAPGGKHIALSKDRQVVLDSEQGRYRHQPSVDVLFESAARVYGPRAIAVLLTGMGDDGAEGMAALRARGARTLVQDQESCVVFGMPAAAIERRAVEYVLPLQQIPTALIELAQPSPTSR